MIFNRINVLDPNVHNVVHDPGKLRLLNTGGRRCRSSRSRTGPWKVVGTPPTSDRGGPVRGPDRAVHRDQSAGVHLQPDRVHHQPARRGSVLRVGHDQDERPGPPHADGATGRVVAVAVGAQRRAQPADDRQPRRQLQRRTSPPATRRNAPRARRQAAVRGGGRTSAYWTRADPTRNVSIRLLAAWQGRGRRSTSRGTRRARSPRTPSSSPPGAESQSFLPHLQGNPSARRRGASHPAA